MQPSYKHYRLIRALMWQCSLSYNEANACIKAYQSGDAYGGGEAVLHYGGPERCILDARAAWGKNHGFITRNDHYDFPEAPVAGIDYEVSTCPNCGSAGKCDCTLSDYGLAGVRCRVCGEFVHDATEDSECPYCMCGVAG